MIDLTKQYPVSPHETWNVVDSTKFNTLAECPRKFFFRFILGWESTAPNNHLKFGEAWHVAMKHLLDHGYTPEAVLEASQKFTDCYRPDFPESTDELYVPKTPAYAKSALLEYIATWPNDLNEYEVLHTEVSGTVPITREWPVFFRMDSILRERSTGHYGSLEHKTRGGSFSSSYVLQFPRSFQIGMYNHVLYCLYPPDEIFGVKINGVGFLKTKFDMQRFPFKRSPLQMQAWMDTVTHYLYEYEDNMRELEEESPSSPTMRAFPCNPSACDKYYGCPYHDFCDAWPNLLQNCYEPPLGFEVRFWDPREEVRDAEVMNL